MKLMKILNHEVLVQLNENSQRAGRHKNIRTEWLQGVPRERYHVTYYTVHEWAGQHDVRVCVVLNSQGRTAWMDVSPEEFRSIPQVEVSEEEWESAMCAGTPPFAPTLPEKGHLPDK